MRTFKLIILCFFLGNLAFSQGSNELKLINQHIWQPFTKAFETLDYKLFESIHDSSLLRVSGDQKTIRTFKTYLDGYEQRWKNSTRKQTISFRFLERISNDNYASERGIYKLTLDSGTKQERSFFGKFHVLHRKINGQWKIILDYDSNEENTIDEKSYLSAHSIDALEKY